MGSDIRTILVDWPIVDGGLAVVWFLISASVWRSYQPPDTVDKVDERALGATVIMGQLNATITGASIILAGLGAFVALNSGKFSLSASCHLYYAALWTVLALFAGLWTMSLLPQLAPSTNFVRSPKIAILCSMGLFFCLAAGVRFLFAVRAILPN